jgi:hypothetical protein
MIACNESDSFYFGGRKISEVASYEQLSPFPTLRKFPCPWSGGNSPRSGGNGDNCSQLATSLIFLPPK